MKWLDKWLDLKVPAYYLGFVTLALIMFGFTQIRVSPDSKLTRFYLGDRASFHAADGGSFLSKGGPSIAVLSLQDDSLHFVDLYVEHDTVRFKTDMPLDKASQLLIDHLLALDTDYIYWSKQERKRIGECLHRARIRIAELNGEIFECE